MFYQFENWDISDDLFKEFEVAGDENKTLSKLAKLNIFVGPNNSGKSRLMRKLFQQEQEVSINNIIDIDKLNKLSIRYKNLILANFPHSNADFGKINERWNNVDNKDKKTRSTDYGEKSGTIKNKLAIAKYAIENISRFDDLTDEAKEVAKKIYEFIESRNT